MRQLCRLAIRLLHSPLPTLGPEAAYLFQELDCNLASVAAGAARLLAERPQITLLVLGVENDRLAQPLPGGYGATPALMAALANVGIGSTSVEVAHYDHSAGINTLTEAEALVSHVKMKGWRSLAVVAPSFHLPRAAMTVASVARKSLPELLLYPVAGGPLPWQEQGAHSQGMLGIRADFIDSELDRIVRYTTKGDISPMAELEAYFAHCETAAPPS